MPIIFTLLFGIAFGGFGSGDQVDPRMPVAINDLDQSELSERLQNIFQNSTVIRLEPDQSDQDMLEVMVADGDIAAAMVVPENFGRVLSAENVQPITVITNNTDNSGFAVENEVEAAAKKLRTAVVAAEVGANMYQQQIGFPDEESRVYYYGHALDQALQAWQEPPVQLQIEQTASHSNDSQREFGAAENNAFSQTSPGMMAQFAIAGLMGAAAVIVVERKNRSLHRLLTTPITKAEIILGHYMAMFVMIFAQLIVLMVFGQLVLRLNYFQEPIASLMVVTITAMFAASLGLLIGALAKNEDQVTVFALIPMFILAGLGGAWVPMEITPEGFQRFGRLTPVAFIIDAFQDIIVRGQGLEAVWLSVIVLLGYTIILILLAVWRFRFD